MAVPHTTRCSSALRASADQRVTPGAMPAVTTMVRTLMVRSRMAITPYSTDDR
jgi:hypothetical protein